MKKQPPNYAQQDIFRNELMHTYMLCPDSPKKAFYELSIEWRLGEYFLVKKSGAGDKILDVREWNYPSFEKAEKAYNLKIRQKTNPDKKLRKYILV